MPRKDVPGALVASGCGTDHLAPENAKSVDDVIRGYEEQMAAIEKLGGKLIVMASRALARVARSPGRLRTVYDRILSPGEAAGRAALAGRHVRPGAGRLLGQQADVEAAPWTPRWASSRRMPARSTASRSRCWTRTRKSRCAGACPRACACTPATTSTTPS
jgi:hypothetical protein